MKTGEGLLLTVAQVTPQDAGVEETARVKDGGDLLLGTGKRRLRPRGPPKPP